LNFFVNNQTTRYSDERVNQLCHNVNFLDDNRTTSLKERRTFHLQQAAFHGEAIWGRVAAQFAASGQHAMTWHDERVSVFLP